MMNNFDIRMCWQRLGLKNWEIAAEVGISEATFCRWLRVPLTEEQRESILQAIDRLSSQKGVAVPAQAPSCASGTNESR